MPSLELTRLVIIMASAGVIIGIITMVPIRAAAGTRARARAYFCCGTSRG